MVKTHNHSFNFHKKKLKHKNKQNGRNTLSTEDKIQIRRQRRENKQNFRFYYTMFKLTLSFVCIVLSTGCAYVFASITTSVAAATCIDLLINSFLLLLSFKFTDFIYRKCCFCCIAVQSTVLGISFVIQQKLDHVLCVVCCVDMCYDCKQCMPHGFCCNHCPCCNHDELTDGESLEKAAMAKRRQTQMAKTAKMNKQRSTKAQILTMNLSPNSSNTTSMFSGSGNYHPVHSPRNNIHHNNTHTNGSAIKRARNNKLQNLAGISVDGGGQHLGQALTASGDNTPADHDLGTVFENEEARDRDPHGLGKPEVIKHNRSLSTDDAMNIGHGMNRRMGDPNVNFLAKLAVVEAQQTSENTDTENSTTLNHNNNNKRNHFGITRPKSHEKARTDTYTVTVTMPGGITYTTDNENEDNDNDNDDSKQTQSGIEEEKLGDLIATMNVGMTRLNEPGKVKSHSSSADVVGSISNTNDGMIMIASDQEMEMNSGDEMSYSNSDDLSLSDDDDDYTNTNTNTNSDLNVKETKKLKKSNKDQISKTGSIMKSLRNVFGTSTKSDAGKDNTNSNTNTNSNSSARSFNDKPLSGEFDENRVP